MTVLAAREETGSDLQGELVNLHNLALEGTDAKCLAREAAEIGIKLVFGKIHRGTALFRLQEISEILCSSDSGS